VTTERLGRSERKCGSEDEVIQNRPMSMRPQLTRFATVFNTNSLSPSKKDMCLSRSRAVYPRRHSYIDGSNSGARIKTGTHAKKCPNDDVRRFKFPSPNPDSRRDLREK
jgi:hypothetical protein